ncbi:MAG: GAF domain-containing protein, partial [Anaerolineae bacterium]|nr:GAF domain-containing protein [Anaerolineae bacterium]
TFKHYYVALFILEPGQEVLRCRASAGDIRPQPDQDAASPVLQVRLGQGIIGHVAQTGVELLANDVDHEPLYRYVDSLPETRSEVALPLKIEDHVMGVLDVQSDQPERFDETDMLVLRALADNIAIAVEGTRLHEGLRRRADQLSTVAEISRAITSILNLDTLFDKVVTLIHKRLGYPFVHLFTVDHAHRQIVYRAGLPLTPPRGEPEGGGPACSLDDSEGIVPWVARHGETVLADDVSRDSRYRPSGLPPADAHAQLTVPLAFGGQVLGVLDVQSDSRDAFGDDDRFLFEALADNVAIAIRNANLYRSEQWRRQVADSMREVAGLLSAGVALDQVLDAILAELERTLPCDAAAVWLLHDDDLCLVAVHGYAAEVCASDFSPDTSPWLGRALHADQPTIRTPQSPFEPLGSTLGFPSDYSAIAAPLRIGDRRLGLLTLVHRTPGRYGAESRAMTAAFASYAAVAIENTRLYQAAQEQAYVSTVLLQVAEATQSLTTLDQVLETVVRLTPMLVGVGRCALLLWDEPAAAFVPAAAYGLNPAQQATCDRWHIAPGDVPAFDHLRLSKAPIVIHDTATDPRVAGAGISALGFESLLLLPLLARGAVLGTMLVDCRSEQPGLSASEQLNDERLAIIQGIAYQTASAVENARLLEAQQEEAYVSAALLQVAQAVVSFNDLDDILRAVVRITPILVGVERCIIFLWDDDQSVFRPTQAYGVPRDTETAFLARRYAPGDFPLLDAVREHDSLIAHSGGDDLIPSDFIADFVRPPQGEPHALLGVPLSVKGDVLGVMLIEETGTTRGSSERRLEIITGIAHQAALAMQNDRLQQEMAERERLERELQLAREIQQTFMPSQLPHLPGWEL